MSLLERLWIEKRTHPSNPADWLLYGLSGDKQTSAGILVDEEQAMRLTTVFACVKILSESIASLPLMLYQRRGNNGNRGRKRADSHPLYDLLHTAPNEEMTSFEWREVCMRDLGLCGNHYSFIDQGSGGRARQIIPLTDPSRMTVKREPDSGELYYVYRKPDGGYNSYAARLILHLRGLGSNGINGLSPIGQAREAIGLAFAAEGSGAKLFSQGLMPSGAFTHPETMDRKAKAQFKKSLKEAVGGLENWHKVLLLQEGMKWEPMTIPPDDAQFLETRKFQVAEIARIYRIPPHMLADLERATFSNIEHQSLEFVIYTLTPWLVRIEQRYNASLLSPSERAQGYFFEHSVMGLLRGDVKSRYEAYRTARSGGWLNANEIRALENMNPIEEGKGGDSYLWPLNMAPSEMVLGGALPQAPQKQGLLINRGIIASEDISRALPAITEARILEVRQSNRDRFLRLFEEAVGRIVNRETIAVGRAVKKHLGERSLEAFNSWLDEFYGTMQPHVLRQMEPLFITYADAVIDSMQAEMVLGEEVVASTRLFTEAYAEGFAKRHIGSSLNQLRKIIKEASPAELAAAIEARLEGWAEARAVKTATDEVVRAENAVMVEAWGKAGVEKIRWITYGGACPWCNQLNGRVVAIHGAFLEKGHHLTHDENGETQIFENWTSQLHPPLHRGCKCSVGVA